MNTLAERWQWTDLDPLTRTVVAAFGDRIGDNRARGDMSSEAFVDAMTEAFDDMTPIDVIKTAECSGLKGLRNTIINRLSGFTGEQVPAMAQQLGRLAGDSEATHELATQAAEQLAGDRGQEAAPAIRVLSELAIGLRYSQ